jgi:acyl-coenzyme A thioesterase PaaI-like protein
MELADLKTPIPFERTFDAQLGLVYDRVSPEEVTATLPVRDAVRSAEGPVPGGVFAAIAEGMASMGTAVGVLPEGSGAAGMSNDTRVLVEVVAGDVAVVARRRGAEPDLWVWDVEARDADGRPCAVSVITIAVRPLRA